MQRLTIVALALAALPLFADDAKKAEAKPAAQPAAAQATAQEESPLVAAARRANRGAKKAKHVITNETLVKANSGTARVTTTEKQRPIDLSPLPAQVQPTPEMAAAQKAKEERAKVVIAEDERKAKTAAYEQRRAAAAERAEEGMYEELEDPDYGEGERDLQQTQTEKPPQV